MRLALGPLVQSDDIRCLLFDTYGRNVLFIFIIDDSVRAGIEESNGELSGGYRFYLKGTYMRLACKFMAEG
jgi:hypothetical protein